MNKNIKERIKYWAQIFLVPLYLLSFLMPRNKKIWLFGSTFGRRFTDNPRYLYLYVSHDKDALERGIRPVWISHNKDVVKFLTDNGYEAYYYHSFKGIWLALRAGVYIFDNYSKDINFWQSGGAVKVNLWHGSGNKLTNHDNQFDTIRHPKNAWEKWKTWLRRLSDEKPSHYILSTSDAKKVENMSAFQVDEKHILINGQPRNDMLIGNDEYAIEELFSEEEKKVIASMRSDKEAGMTILAFMPTFRPSESKFFEVMDFARFNDFLEDNHYRLYVKPHPKSRIIKRLEELNSGNIYAIKSEVDVYSFLKNVDMLIADYSSVYTDFMLLDRPVAAFWFDEEEYVSQNRDSYIPAEEYMPEIVAKNMDELMDSINRVLTEDSCLYARRKSRDRYFNDINGKYAKDMYEQIMKISR